MRRTTASFVKLIGVLCTLSLVASACATKDPRESEATLATKSAAPYPTRPVHLTMWWWGEQEAPGAKQWLADTIAKYHARHRNVQIKTVLQTTDGLIPSFQAAAAARKGPDIEYFWGGIYSQQPAWADDILPISDYLPASELKHYINASREDTYRGKIVTAPWYVNPSFPVLARKDLLAKHGLTVPTTWSQLLATCDKLSSAGIPTLVGGVKDGWFGGWLYSLLGGQSISSTRDIGDAVTGRTKFTNAVNSGWWQRLEETRQHKCWNSDINSLELYQAQQRWVAGNGAITVAAGSDAPNLVDKVGADKVRVMPMPKWGNGPYAGKMGTTSQTVGLTSWTKYPQVGADFIRFMHSPERLQAWYDKTGSMPADDRFDVASVKDPVRRSLFQQTSKDAAPYIENFIPPQLDSEAVFTNVQLVLKGTKTAKQAADEMQGKAERLRVTDRSLVKNYHAWLR